MKAIAHLSDLHFGEADPAIVAALTAELTAQPPDLVVVSGDLTKGARHREFAAARAFFDQLPSRVLAVPGNHDISPYRLIERFTRPFARYRHWMNDGTEPSYLDDEIAVLGLNSARSWGPHLNWAHGRLSHEQISRAASRLADIPRSIFKIVVLHHPVLEPRIGAAQRIVGRLPGALKALDEAGTDLILAGHLHTGEARDLKISPDRSILAIQCASATSARQRGEPNAYNRLTLDGTRLTIEVRAWNGAGFQDVQRADWIKGAAGWTAPGS